MTIQKNWIRKMKTVFMTVLLAGLLMSQTVYAIDPLQVGASVALKINCHPEAEIEFPEVGFCIYKVGEIDEFAEVTPIGEFADYPVEYAQEDASGWKALAQTLAGFVKRDQIEPYDYNVTDAKGVTEFPAGDKTMTTGLYLVTGETYVYNQVRYQTQPMLICLPNRDVDDTWIYEQEIMTKYDSEDELTEVKVIKEWKDNDDSAKKRPQEIEVQLLKDGEVFETVKLNKENDWRYTWSDLKPAEWTVTEKDKVDGYTVLVEQDEDTFVVENTYKDNHPTTNPHTPNKKLPQTGMLWWPVPLLAGAGMLCFLAGWTMRRKNEQ